MRVTIVCTATRCRGSVVRMKSSNEMSSRAHTSRKMPAIWSQ
jgi:hypothetical protein